MSQQHALAANKSNSISDCTKKSIPRSIKLLPLLCTSKITSEIFEIHIQFWIPHHKNYMDMLDQVQQRTTKIMKGLEHLSYEERLRDLGLFSLKKEGSGSTLLMGMNVQIKKTTSAILSCVRDINSTPENSVSTSLLSFFTVKVVKHRNRLPSYVVEPWNIFGY